MAVARSLVQKRVYFLPAFCRRLKLLMASICQNAIGKNLGGQSFPVGHQYHIQHRSKFTEGMQISQETCHGQQYMQAAFTYQRYIDLEPEETESKWAVLKLVTLH